MLSPTPLGQNPADSTSFAPVRPLSVHVFTFHGHLGKTRNNGTATTGPVETQVEVVEGADLTTKIFWPPPSWAGREREAEGPQLRTLDRIPWSACIPYVSRMYPICIRKVSS